MKHRSKSQESLSRHKRSRSKNYDDDSDSDRSRKNSRSKSRDRNYSDEEREERRKRRGRSKSRDRDYSDDELNDRRRKSRSKSRDYSEDDDDDDRYSKSSRSKPRPKPRKSNGSQSHLSDDSIDDLDDGMSSGYPPSHLHYPPQPVYPPVVYPAGYPMAYAPPGAPYPPNAPGGPPLGKQQKPPLAPKPTKKSKWDQLVALTDGERQRQRGESVAETESVLSGSAWGGQRGPPVGFAPPSYTTAQNLPDPQLSTISSAYPDSSGAYPSPPRRHNYSMSSTEI